MNGVSFLYSHVPRETSVRRTLTTVHAAAYERTAATTTACAGEAVDGRPANSSVVSNPTFTIGRQACEESDLTVTTVRLRPMATTDRFKTTQIKGVSACCDAVGITLPVNARQQARTAGAVGQERALGRSAQRQ